MSTEQRNRVCEKLGLSKAASTAEVCRAALARLGAGTIPPTRGRLAAMQQISIGSTKGKYSGSIDQCAEWLARMQPSGSYVEVGRNHEDIEVHGTPGASGWRRGIEEALRRMED